jgi:hypothetical protein
LANIAVVPAAVWYGIVPPEPPARLVAVVAVVADVAVVAVVAVAAFPPIFKPAAVPVMFVPTNAEGVPKAGVTNEGEFDKTTFPVPVEEVTPVPPFATGKVLLVELIMYIQALPV